MSAQHTPGPWEADGATHEGQRYHQISSGGSSVDTHSAMHQEPITVCDTTGRDASISAIEDRANALLLAAAPELADTLSFASEVLSLIPLAALLGEKDEEPLKARVEEAVRDARAVLAKAGRLS